MKSLAAIQLKTAQVIYAANATLLICREIDSAFWREWELFRIPGGSDLFVALHIPLIAIVLLGLILIVRGHRCWRLFSLFLGASGTVGGLLHMYFLLQGDSRFTSWFSIGLIAAFLTTSILQVIVTCATWHRDTPETEHNTVF